jgi:hypothetical protein
LPFITFVRRDSEGRRDYGSKVRAILDGCAHLGDVPYEFIGNLDADITFEPFYYERMIQKFRIYQRLGIAGGVTFDVFKGTPHPRRASLDSVGGAVQLFRRECYEAIGGYVPVHCGMEDSAAIYKARFLGWECRSFPDLPVMHHRPTGTAGRGILRARMIQGEAMWAIGWSPWWVAARMLYKFPERPYVVGSCIRTLGYFHAKLARRPQALSPELRQFIQNEQHNELRRMLFLPQKKEGKQ